MNAQVPPAAGERHHLTVLFIDVVGSTTRGREVELEQGSGQVDVFRRVVDREAERRGGRVYREMGDGTLVVFGMPAPSENDGLQAAEVALAVHRRMARLARRGWAGLPPDFAVRSGISSGTTLVKPGGARRGEHDLYGDPPNVSATLQTIAEPGSILASSEVLGPLAPMFDFVEVPRPEAASVHPKQKSWDKLPAAMKVLELRARRPVQRRFDATLQRGLTPFMGREDDLGFLLQVLRAGERSPRCVVVQAEPGLGKTRLLEEFVARGELAGWRVLRGNCESFAVGGSAAGAAGVLQPFMQMVRGLGLPANVDVLAGHFAQECARQPTLLLVDDWQWADDASRQLLVALLELPEGPRVILAARPREDGTGWITGAPHRTLAPLSREQTHVAVQRWLPGAGPFVSDRIHEYAGGVPLYVEELCHSASADLWHSLEAGAPQQSWLKSLVGSRLSRLAELRPAHAAVLRAAAVIGYVVPLPLLDLVCEAPPTPAMLRELTEADFLYPDNAAGSMRFKHGLTRDAVYEKIGFYDRTRLHEKIESVLLARAPEARQPDDPEALAYHANRAGHWQLAAQFAERAGDRALGAHAMDRARAQYHAALLALDRLPRSRETSAQWCLVANKLGMACIFDTLSLGQDFRIFEQAVARARELDDTNALARCKYWLGYIRYGLGDFRVGVTHTRDALALAQASGDRPLADQIAATLGQILAAACEYDQALPLMNAALDAKKERSAKDGAAPRPSRGIAVGSAYTLACKGSVLADRGEFDAAHACFSSALALLVRSAHPVGTSVRNWIATALIWQGRWDEAVEVATESARIAENTRALLLLAVSRTAIGFARWSRGEREGLAQMRDAIGWITARRVKFFTSLFNGWLCEACVAAGELGEARRAAAVVLRRAREGDRLGEACAARAMARVSAAAGRGAAALRWLARADASAAVRGSVREEALNRDTRAEVARLLAGEAGRAAPAAATLE